MDVCVIIPAAGGSTRWGGSLPKLDEDLGGRPVLHRTVELFAGRDEVASIVVAGPFEAGAWGEFSARHADRLSLLGATLCRGGETHRWQTVRAALEHVPESATHVAVHDAARPCASGALIDRVFDAARAHAAVVPAVEVSDTLKRVGEPAAAMGEADPFAEILGTEARSGAPARRVVETVPRQGLWAAQTPQVFEAGLLRRAYSQEDLASTDDAELVERLGEPVVVVEGDPLNIKLTRLPDLRIAMAVLGLKPPAGRAAHKRF